MERLTKRGNGHAYYPRCFKEPCYGSGCKIKDCPFETEVCERLTAYEDTGLTPEQVYKMYGEYCLLESALKNYGSHKRMKELAEADKGGRIVVLPCKVGDTVWRLKRTFETWPDTSKPYIEADAFLLQDIWKIGKSVFLTLSAAEKALAGLEEKRNG